MASSIQKSSESKPFRSYCRAVRSPNPELRRSASTSYPFPVDDTLIFDAQWPNDLDPSTVPFRKRSITILRRAGFFDDWSLFNTLTEFQVLSWTTAGVGTVADIRTTGNAALVEYHGEAFSPGRSAADFASLADEPWARHIWDRDPRFKAYLSKGGGTAYGIVTSGTDDDRMLLWDNLEALRKAVAVQAGLTLPDAVSEYVEAISGQHGERLDVLLAVTGLNGQDPISDSEGSRRIGVSRIHVGQLRRRLFVMRDQARPPAGVWMPQVMEAEREGWPDRYTGEGMEATSGFFEAVGD